MASQRHGWLRLQTAGTSGYSITIESDFELLKHITIIYIIK